MYKGNGEEVVLASLFNSYLELDTIFVSTSGPSFYLFTDYLITDYYSNGSVNDFDLRRLFYSKQDFKNACYSSA